MSYSFLACLLVSLLLVTAVKADDPAPAAGEVLWANSFDDEKELGQGAGEIIAKDDRKAVLEITKATTADSALRTFNLPVERLRGRWVYLSADVMAKDVSAKPVDWNGVKVMLKIDTPAETHWPMIPLPVGSFDWRRPSMRVLIPPDASAITLVLGLEQVSGGAWFANPRLTLGKAVITTPAASPDKPIFKGHDLPALRGAMVHPQIKREDLGVLADWGGNLIRYQLLHIPKPQSQYDPATYDRWLEGELKYLDGVLTWARELGVKVVVDLHSPPGGAIGGNTATNASGPFWTNPKAQAHFVKAWQLIAQRYKGNEVIWGFDLLNEPEDRSVIEGCEDWQALAARAGKAIRQIDPQRTLIVEPNASGGPQGFIGFEPLDLERVVYSFHVYSPMEFTHQALDAPADPVTYPGRIGQQMWDKAALEAHMKPAIDFARKHRVHLYVGEFSAIRWAPGAAQYLTDLTSIFEANGWDWSYHAFREWHGWNLELGPDRSDQRPTAAPSDRLEVIKRWLVKSHRAVSIARRYPAGSVIDVTQPPYLAVPDDGRNDSPAIQRAITDHIGTGRILYFPAGIYDIQQPLLAKEVGGKWQARLNLQGESREKTILRLTDRNPAFADASTPAAVITTGSVEEPGDSPDGGGNKAFGNYIRDMTIDTGSGNPGAKGIDWAVSNFGAIKNVSVRSGDGQGSVGISIARRIPGPGLIQHVSVEGFDIGIDVADVQYGITMDDVTLRNQKVAGIRVDINVLHIHKLSSVNRQPAVVGTGAQSVLTLIDASLTGGREDQPAMAWAGSLLLRDINTQGYARAVRRGGVDLESADIAQYVWPAPLGAGDPGVADSTTLLPISSAPEVWESDLSQWAAVGPRRGDESDDTAAIQRAIDSGKRVVYFVNDRTYFISDTLVIRGAVRHVLGMGSEISLGAAEKPFGDIANPRPLFRIDPTDHATLVIELLFFNAQYPGEVIFENNSPVTVAIKHCGGWVGAAGHRRGYRNTPQATGPLFIEDVYLPGWHFTRQHVWARQLNPENFDGDGTEAQVLNEGGRLWILGFKTEGPAPFISTTNHGMTELLGGYNYISATAAPSVPIKSVPYLSAKSQVALTFVTDNYRKSDYEVYVRQTQQPNAQWTGAQLWHRNGGNDDGCHVVPLFRSGEHIDAQDQ